MFKLAANEEKVIKTAFAKKSKATLSEEIEELEFVKQVALKNEPGLDVSELDYYIKLRKEVLGC